MLNEVMKRHIRIVAAISGNHISTQNLMIIQNHYNTGEGKIADALKYCEEMHITVFDEMELALKKLEAAEIRKEQEMEKRVQMIREEQPLIADLLDSFRFVPDDKQFKSLDQIKAAMAGMRLRRIELLSYRFGFIDGRGHTQDETADKFDISIMTVRKMEAQYLRKLKN